MDKKLKKILDKIDGGDLVCSMAHGLSGSEFQTLMLNVFDERAKQQTPANVLANYMQNRFTKPSPVSQEKFRRLEDAFYEIAGGEFQSVELSPAAPLGSCSVFSTVSQNKVISSLRNTEAVSDATNVMALECAARRKESASRNELTKLYTSHRLVRAQRYSDPKNLPHFRLISMCTAGRDTGNSQFETQNCIEHINCYIVFLSRYIKKESIKVTLYTFAEEKSSVISGKIAEYFKKHHREVVFETDTQTKSGGNYYTGLRFIIGMKDEDGSFIGVADGGITDWTQKYLNDRKERLLISAIGIEMMAYLSN